MVNNLKSLEAIANVPEYLPDYVNAVSDLNAAPCAGGILHYADKTGVLSIFPEENAMQKEVDDAVDAALKFAKFDNLTVLAPVAPSICPPTASISRDHYWAIETDAEISAKTRNMIKRAQKDTQIRKTNGKNCWTEQHDQLVKDFCARKKSELSDATCFIFSRMPAYLQKAPKAALFSAYNSEGQLTACAIADFSAFATAFYMFAFRSPIASPGTADLLLWHIFSEAKQLGHMRLNLGLGINSGVEYFKKKWGAIPWLNYCETQWQIPKKSWFAKLFGK